MPGDKPIKFEAPIESHAQYIFEQAYLRPFPGKASENKTDLYQLPVERSSHGVQHAARVAILVRILAHFLTQTQYKDANLLDEKTIKLLEIVALCHDAARKNDSEAERWDNESAKYCVNYLSELGEKAALAKLIYQKEEGGLLGQILQSADCLDDMRWNEQFDISRMSLWAFFNKQQKKQFLAIIQEQLSLIAEQHDLKHDLNFTIMGKKFSQKATRDALHPELKQAYEQADNAYMKTLDGLQNKKRLLAVYHNQKNTVSTAPKDTATDGKSEEEAPDKNTAGAFKKAPFLLAAEMLPEVETYRLMNLWYQHSYSSKEEAEGQLALVVELLGAKHPELKVLRIKKEWHKDINPYYFSLTPKQEEHLNKIKTHPRLVKSIRWDSLCFIEDFILGITPLKNEPRHHQDLRPGPHKKFTTFFKGVYAYEDRPSPYPEDQLHKKEKRSQHQSTSLVTRKAQIPVFGHNKDRMNKLAGVILDADDALVNRYFICDSATIYRPYEAHTLAEAQAYHQRVTNSENPILFSDRQALEKALEKNTKKHNEVLARIRWKVSSSSVGIFNDSFEARCVARYYAERIYTAVKTQYKAAGKPWDEDYKVPITYYIPGNNKNWSSYSEKTRREDTEKAHSIYNDPIQRKEAIENGNGEFLLLLDNPEAVWQSLLADDSFHPLITMIEQKQFQLIEALHHRAGHKAFMEDFKDDEGKALLFEAAKSNSVGILKLFLDLHKDRTLSNAKNKDGHTALFSAAQKALLFEAAKSNRLRILKFILDLDKDKTLSNAKNKDGHTALFYAAQEGHLDIVQALLKNGADVNRGLNGVPSMKFAAKFLNYDETTPLYFAARRGHFDVVLALLENGADTKHAAGWLEDANLPHRAARAGNRKLLQWLAVNQPGLLIKKKSTRSGLTVAQCAALSGNPECLNVALSLSKEPHSFTMAEHRDNTDNQTSVNSLLKALDDNFTLTTVRPYTSITAEIARKLARNKAFEKVTEAFSDYAKGHYQKASPVSAIPPDELYDNFKRKVPGDMPEKQVRITFDRIINTASPQGKQAAALSIIEEFSKDQPTSNQGNLLHKMKLLETNAKKIPVLSGLKLIMGEEHAYLDDLQEKVIAYYKKHEKDINDKRNKIHALFMPNHKTTTGKMFDEIFKALDISETDISAAQFVSEFLRGRR